MNRLARRPVLAAAQAYARGAATAAKVPIELHYAPTPNGWKVTLLLEEALMPYVVRPCDLGAGDQHSEDFLRISPNGRMPAIVDRNVGDGLAIFESGALMVHLCEHYAPQFLPTDAAGRSQALQWLFWVNAGLGPMAGQVSHFSYYAPKLAPDADHSYSLDRYKREFERLISVMERQLSATAFLAGDEYGVADMAAFPWVKPWRRWMGRGLDEAGFPNVFRWYEAIKARPATERAFAVLRNEAVAGQKMRESKDGLSEEGKGNMFSYQKATDTRSRL
jgi:GST-like protein